MKLIGFLLKLLLLIAIGIGIYWAYVTFYLRQPFSLDSFGQLSWQNFSLDTAQTQLTSSAQDASTFAQKSFTDTVEKGKILGAQIQTSDSKSLPQETFEYARFLYCQQITKEWEKDHPTTASTAATLPSASVTPSDAPTASPISN